MLGEDAFLEGMALSRGSLIVGVSLVLRRVSVPRCPNYMHCRLFVSGYGGV